MNRATFSAMILTLALGTTVNAAAKNNDPYDAHKAFEKREHHQQVRNHEGERWKSDHRTDQRHDLDRERREREAMHRWDREHHRGPMVVNHHEPKHEGWDRGRKTGVHHSPARHAQRKHRSYVNHHYDRHGARPANQQVMNRPPRDGRTAPVAR